MLHVAAEDRYEEEACSRDEEGLSTINMYFNRLVPTLSS